MNLKSSSRFDRSVPLLALIAAAMLSCEGGLDSRFLDGSSQSNGACTSDDVQRLVFNASCVSSGCHDNSNQPSGGLDLLSAGAEQRLTGFATPAGQVCATSRTPILIVPGDPAHSLLMLKVEPSPPCGSRMPFGTATALSDRQIECMRSWIASLPPGVPFDSGVPPVDSGTTDAAHIDAASMDVAPSDVTADTAMDSAASVDVVTTDSSGDTGIDAPMDAGAPDDSSADTADTGGDP